MKFVKNWTISDHTNTPSVHLSGNTKLHGLFVNISHLLFHKYSRYNLIQLSNYYRNSPEFIL